MWRAGLIVPIFKMLEMDVSFSWASVKWVRVCVYVCAQKETSKSFSHFACVSEATDREQVKGPSQELSLLAITSLHPKNN